MTDWKCPRDGSPLQSREIHDHEVQACLRCEGIFLEQGGLNEVAEEIPGDLEISTLELESFEHPDEFPPASCPQDPEVEMVKVEFVGDSGIILDYCRHCHGFWLDGHELEQINERVRQLNAAAAEIHDPPWIFLARLMASITQ